MNPEKKPSDKVGIKSIGFNSLDLEVWFINEFSVAVPAAVDFSLGRRELEFPSTVCLHKRKVVLKTPMIVSGLKQGDKLI